ncbi:MAG: esterase [Roseiarcus sp.]
MRWLLVALAMIALCRSASAAEVVALGASNTAGRGYGRYSGGVDPDQAFPAQLERILRAQNCSVSVLNAGLAGDTTSGLFQRLPGAVSADTKVLIFETPISNDRAKGLSHTGQNRVAILAFAKAHGLTAISLSPLLPGIAGAEHRDPDGQHFDAVGHLNIAKSLAACRTELSAIKLRCRFSRLRLGSIAI